MNSLRIETGQRKRSSTWQRFWVYQNVKYINGTGIKSLLKGNIYMKLSTLESAIRKTFSE